MHSPWCSSAPSGSATGFSARGRMEIMLPYPPGGRGASVMCTPASSPRCPTPRTAAMDTRFFLDGGVRPEGLFPASSLKHAPNDWMGRDITSPLGDNTRRVRQRLNPDAEPDSDSEEDEFFDATAEQQDLDDDERVEGPGQTGS